MRAPRGSGGGSRSYLDEGELGYGVLISWLRSAEIAPRLPRLAATDVAELGRILPELVDDTAEVAASSPVPDAAEERRRLFEAASRGLLGSGRPTLLIADDAHWCDEQSLQLIHHLVRRNPGSPLLVVGTVRGEDLDDTHMLETVGGGLQAIDRASEVALGRLWPADTEALARLVARPTSTRRPSRRCAQRPRATRCSLSRRCAPALTASGPAPTPAHGKPLSSQTTGRASVLAPMRRLDPRCRRSIELLRRSPEGIVQYGQVKGPKAVVEELFRRLPGDDHVLDDLVAEDMVNHAAGPQGREGLRQILDVIRHDLGDGEVAHHHLIADGEFVANHVTLRGVHRASTMPLLAGTEPTGAEVSWTFIHIWRVVDDQIVEHWACRDDLGLLHQIGAWPPTTTT